MARTDMDHAATAEGLLADPEYAQRLNRDLHFRKNPGTYQGIYYREARARVLMGAVCHYVAFKHPAASLEDLLTVATLVERSRTA
ncbi:hypothetical protein [Tsuneonella sp. HG222]